MIAFLTLSISGGGYHKFRVPSFDHHPPPGVSIPANSYVNKKNSRCTLYGTVGETVKSGTQCSLVDGSWGGGSFSRNVGVFPLHQQQAQPTDSCTATRTFDLKFYSNLFSRLLQTANIETKDLLAYEFASVCFQFLENFSVLVVLSVEMISILDN
jgi:hypothetical protein